MKKILILFAIVLVSALAVAQTTQTAPTPAVPGRAQAKDRTLAEILDWMMGSWEGQGVARGMQFQGRMSVVSELDGTTVLLTRESMDKNGDPSGGLKELMVVGYDPNTKKIVATIFDNKSNISWYSGDLKEGQLDLSLVTQATGYVGHRVLRQLPDGAVGLTIEGATPGKQVAKWVEISFKKKM
jgi:hypothetical protein